MSTDRLRITILGPCASGKSTLIAELKKRGYQASHIAQEHSFIPDLWHKWAGPDILIFLDVSYDISKQRQGIKHWSHSLYEKQVNRLRHAREHADLLLNTNNLSPREVVQHVLEYLDQWER
ncbi:MAG: hypothetical protein MAG431_00565 [Chloroflexi bacterium]|nr:hypothetical protein [Chloroflexota bacterium]